MNLIVKTLIIILFSSCTFFNLSFAGVWGKGEVKLSKSVMEHLMMYMYGAGSPRYDWTIKQKNKPDVFAASEDGKTSHYMYCPYNECIDPNLPQVIKRCEKRSKGSPCKILALKRKIVWKNGGKKIKIKKSELKDPIALAIKIKNAGFYNGDIYKLAGIDYKTGLTTENDISGNKDNYDYPLLISSLSSEHKESWKDYVEGGNEKFKAWVMAKRKDGDMTWGWEANNISWEDVFKKSLNSCNKFLKEQKNNYSSDTICVLYYKGTKPTNDKEKISTANDYYGVEVTKKFFNKNAHLISDKSLLNNLVSNNLNNDKINKLKELKELLDGGAITKEEFEKLKKQIIN